MIALHKLKVELTATRLAEMILLLPYRQLDILGECPQIEVMLVACQNVWYDALSRMSSEIRFPSATVSSVSVPYLS